MAFGLVDADNYLSLLEKLGVMLKNQLQIPRDVLVDVAYPGVWGDCIVFTQLSIADSLDKHALGEVVQFISDKLGRNLLAEAIYPIVEESQPDLLLPQN